MVVNEDFFEVVNVVSVSTSSVKTERQTERAAAVDRKDDRKLIGRSRPRESLPDSYFFTVGVALRTLLSTLLRILLLCT